MLAAYKVRNADGLYATKGFHSWTKRGKTWSMRGHVTQALSSWFERKEGPIPEDWVLVELTVAGIKERSLREFYAERQAARR